MDELKVTERMELVRVEVTEKFPELKGAAQIGTGVFVVPVEHGFAKVTVSAIKGVDYDVDAAIASYQADLQERADKAAAKAAAKAEKEAAKAAKAAKA